MAFLGESIDCKIFPDMNFTGAYLSG